MKICRAVQACIVTALFICIGANTASGQATQVRIETAANGSGTVVPAQNLTAGNLITVYAISRTAAGVFVSNVATDSIRIINETGGVRDSDLVVAGNRRSAVLTGHGVGTLQIRAYSDSLTSVNSGIITVVPAVAYPASFALSATVSYAQRSNAGDYSATEYRIVGIPGASNARVSSILEGTQNLDWVAYWDNGAASNNFIPFDGSLNFNFSIGRAFWILRKGPLNISTTVPTAPLDTTTNSVDIPIHSGWNLITNPFATAIPWGEVERANGSTLSPIYKFGGSFAISSSLEPYKGYYYFKDVSSSQSVLKIPFGLFTSALAKTLRAASGWKVDIGLTAGGYTDNTTSFGIEPGAREGLDSLEYRKPRSLGDIPSVQFFRPEWDNNFSSFATDFRPAVEDIQTWKFNVHSISREQMELNFSEVEGIPSEFKAYLIDERQAKFINLREQARYNFSSPFSSSEFSVIVGREDKVQEVLNSVGPKEFSLGNNFPNPFNPTTTIPIALPQAADVVVKVYSILGEELRTIFAGMLTPGRYYLVWDGKDKSGNSVASGMYISRFTTNTGKAFTGKMILMK